MKKTAWYVVILLIIMIAAVIICVSRLKQSGSEPAGETSAPVSADVAVTDPPVSTEPEQTPEETPDATDEPVFVTKEPVVSPTPTPAEETPAAVDAGGSFTSDTGTHLNLLVEWSAVSTDGDTAELTINVSATSYSFNTSALYNAISITVDGSTYSMNSPEISYDGDGLTTTPLASKTVTVQLDSTGRANPGITVLWDYRGSYGGTELDSILAIGSASIG